MTNTKRGPNHDQLPGTPTGKLDKLDDGSSIYSTQGNGEDENVPIPGSLILISDLLTVDEENTKLIADRFAKETKMKVFIADLLYPNKPLSQDQFWLPTTASLAKRLLAENDEEDDEKKGQEHDVETQNATKKQIEKSMENLENWTKEKGNDPITISKKLEIVVNYVSNQRKGLPIGLIAYGYGVKPSIILASEEQTKIHALAIYHPAFVREEDVMQIKCSTLFNSAEFDPFLDETQTRYIRARLNSNGKLDARSQTYPNTTFGFGLYPQLKKDEIAKTSFENSIKNTSNFFQYQLATALNDDPNKGIQ